MISGCINLRDDVELIRQGRGKEAFQAVGTVCPKAPRKERQGTCEELKGWPRGGKSGMK